MILLVAAKDSTRSVLASFLEQEKIAVKVCDNIDDGMRLFLEFPQFDVLVADYRAGGGDLHAFMVKLSRKRRAAPLIIIGAPLKAETELFRAGAFAVLGPGFSPRSVALQCANLMRFLERRAPERRKAHLKPVADFQFGDALVSPERGLLLRAHRRAKGESSAPLSRLHLGLLRAFHSRPRRIVNYEFLYHTVWCLAYEGENAVIREAVSSLRGRFQRIGLDFDRWVTTSYGSGFRYDPQRK